MVDLDASDYPDGGVFVTDINLDPVTVDDVGYSKKCVFPFWIRMVDSGTGDLVAAPRCLESQPTWMRDNYAELKDRAVGDLALVEAHDAAAYKYYEFRGDENFASQLTFTQDEELGLQLQWGVRALDMRIAYCESGTL